MISISFAWMASNIFTVIHHDYLKYTWTVIQRSMLLQPISKSWNCPYFTASGSRHPTSVNGHAINFPLVKLPYQGIFFSLHVLQMQFLHIKIFYPHQHFCNKPPHTAQKFSLFPPTAGMLTDLWVLHLIVFAVCQEHSVLHKNGLCHRMQEEQFRQRAKHWLCTELWKG